MNLILMGAPGAGKGTQSEIISEKFNIPAISTGDILRHAIKNETELGRMAKSYIDAGNLVPDEVVIGIIKDHLSGDACKNGFILDGFPRSIAQAEALEAMNVKIDAVLTFDVPDEVIVDRMSKRRMCPDCGMSYHLDYKPSRDNVRCDKCGAELYTRKDDAPETVLARLNTYHAQTEPVLEYYEKKGLLMRFNGVGKVEEIGKMVLDALAKL